MMYIVEIRVYSIMLQSSFKNVRVLNINRPSIFVTNKIIKCAKTIKELNLISSAYFRQSSKASLQHIADPSFRLIGPRPFKSY